LSQRALIRPENKKVVLTGAERRYSGTSAACFSLLAFLIFHHADFDEQKMTAAVER